MRSVEFVASTMNLRRFGINVIHLPCPRRPPSTVSSGTSSTTRLPHRGASCPPPWREGEERSLRSASAHRPTRASTWTEREDAGVVPDEAVAERRFEEFEGDAFVFPHMPDAIRCELGSRSVGETLTEGAPWLLSLHVAPVVPSRQLTFFERLGLDR